MAKIRPTQLEKKTVVCHFAMYRSTSARVDFTYEKGKRGPAHCTMAWVGLYRILPIPIVYGVWRSKGGLGGGSYVAQSSCNSIAMVWAKQIGRGKTRMIRSCMKALK